MASAPRQAWWGRKRLKQGGSDPVSSSRLAWQKLQAMQLSSARDQGWFRQQIVGSGITLRSLPGVVSGSRPCRQPLLSFLLQWVNERF